MENTKVIRSEARTGSGNSRRISPVACASLALLCVAALFLSGCAARALRTDYRDYENSYAESSNRQMLLNLARLSEHHPTYFFKLGQITTNYRYQATLSGNGTYSPPNYPAGPGGGGTPGALFEKDPGFSFVPVNDDSTARQLLQPMPAELFYVLFQQGMRVDELMRLMVDHIEYRPDPNSDVVHTIRNVASESNLKDYLTFLRISALAYHLQRRGHLIFSADQKFQPNGPADRLDLTQGRAALTGQRGQIELQGIAIPIFTDRRLVRHDGHIMHRLGTGLGLVFPGPVNRAGRQRQTDARQQQSATMIASI